MAIAATSYWEIRTTGANTNGAGFDPGMAGMLADLTTTSNTGNTASPVVSSASYNFVSGDVGAWVFIQSGTNWTPGWYQIASVASNQATLTAGVGAAVLYFSATGAASLSTTAGVATVGTPTSGTWAVDYSQQASTKVSNTDFATTGVVTTLTTATGGLGSQMVGNSVHINSGTNFTAGYYFITAVASGTSCTVDRAPTTAAGSAGVGSIGGAGADIGYVVGTGTSAATGTAGNQYWVKAGTYSITSTTANVNGGKIATGSGSSAAQPTRLIGYNTTRADYSTRPLIQVSGAISAFTILQLITNTHIANIILDGASKASMIGTDGSGTADTWYLVKVLNCPHYGINGSGTGSNMRAILCEITACGSTGWPTIVGIFCFYCVMHDNTGPGYDSSSSNTICVGCISCNNTGASSDGFGNQTGTGGSNSYINCVAYNNGRHGFNFATQAWPTTLINCISNNHTAASAFGYNNSAGQGHLYLYNCAAYNNNTNISTNIPAANQFGFITLTADPFANAGGNNFALNSTTGGGALLKSLGVPTSTYPLPGISTSSFLDIGAAQGSDTQPTWIYGI